MSALAKLWAVVWKDLLSEFRTKELLSSMLMFALIVVVIFSFTFETGSTATREVISQKSSGDQWSQVKAPRCSPP